MLSKCHKEALVGSATEWLRKFIQHSNAVSCEKNKIIWLSDFITEELKNSKFIHLHLLPVKQFTSIQKSWVTLNKKLLHRKSKKDVKTWRFHSKPSFKRVFVNENWKRFCFVLFYSHLISSHLISFHQFAESEKKEVMCDFLKFCTVVWFLWSCIQWGWSGHVHPDPTKRTEVTDDWGHGGHVPIIM